MDAVWVLSRAVLVIVMTMTVHEFAHVVFAAVRRKLEGVVMGWEKGIGIMWGVMVKKPLTADITFAPLFVVPAVLTLLMFAGIMTSVEVLAGVIGNVGGSLGDFIAWKKERFEEKEVDVVGLAFVWGSGIKKVRGRWKLNIKKVWVVAGRL